MRRPVIGVLPLYDDERESLWMLPGYLDGLQAAGALPLMLPLQLSEEEFSQIRGGFDGFLFTGGHDVDPALYGQERLPVCGEICPARDALETMVYRCCREADIPVLGICRGIQFINVCEGGTLWQDLPSQYSGQGERPVDHHMSPPYDRVQHRDRILPGTPLSELLGKEELGVNSYHHQAVRELGKELLPMAVSEDGLVEGVYLPGKRFIWGIQWHPEFSYKSDADALAILRAFVEACR